MHIMSDIYRRHNITAKYLVSQLLKHFCHSSTFILETWVLELCRGCIHLDWDPHNAALHSDCFSVKSRCLFQREISLVFSENYTYLHV